MNLPSYDGLNLRAPLSGLFRQLFDAPQLAARQLCLPQVRRQSLWVEATAEADEHVLHGRATQVLTDLRLVVLGDVDEPEAAVGPRLAGHGLEPAADQRQQRGLPGAVPADDADTTCGQELQIEVVERGSFGALVREATPLQGPDRRPRLALHRAWYPLRRRKLQTIAHIAEVVGQGVSGFAVSRLLHHLQELSRLRLVALEHRGLEGVKVTRVVHQLRVVREVDHVRANLVQELGIVRHNHRRATSLAANTRLADEGHQPRHSLGVQVVRGLIQQQQASLLRNGARQGQAHLPAPAQRMHRLLEHLVALEADCLQGFLQVLLRSRRSTLVFELRVLPRGRLLPDAPQDGLVPQVHDAHILREADDILGRDLGHQRRLPRAVGAHHAVAVAPRELQGGIPQQRLRAAAVHQQHVRHSQQAVLG
mmetsp:Transcript_53331/g.152892  ORF Transcript_53331/g.152892 Transcript_53331/m.152892 type:complete len:423 (+) Transcript_53331:574-1842(+)